MMSNKKNSNFSDSVEGKIKRKLEAHQDAGLSVWHGLSLFGLVGWSVVLPTLIGTGIGVWIDQHYSSRHSWTLMLLLGGLILGSINAWHWVEKERRNIHRHEKKNEAKK